MGHGFLRYIISDSEQCEKITFRNPKISMNEETIKGNDIKAETEATNSKVPRTETTRQILKIIIVN